MPRALSSFDGGDVTPVYKTARQLSGNVFPASEAVLLKAAKQYGIGRKLGRCIVFSPNDINLLYEALPCPSNSSKENPRPIGSSAGASKASVLRKAQELVTKGRRKNSGPVARPKSTAAQSTVLPFRTTSRKQL
jgi:hypothetical protein